jgi:signal transduction histidine kinase
MRGWLGSLYGRLVGVLLLGLALAYVFAYASVGRERSEFAASMMGSYVTRDVASAVAMLDRLPAAERPGWLMRLARPNYRYELAPAQGGEAALSTLARQIVGSLQAELGAQRVLGMAAVGDELSLRLRLADGSPLTVQMRPPQRGVSSGTALLLLAQLAAIGLCAWWAVRAATRPLALFAAAAERLGRAPQHAQPLPEGGPREVRRAAAAFNAMQARISALLAERMHILASVSHDLQTPITRMRVRTDLLPDAALRDKLQADLREMQQLVEEGLAYARSSQAAVEPARAIDLQALLDSLCCDYVDAGHRVTLDAPALPPLATRPQALRRVVANLVDNALKFAGAAHIAVAVQPDAVAISVLDDGPGIPESALPRVMQPFERLEDSRSRDTGGTGLGLAIAQQLSAALGGELALRNRAQGGLEARLSLPR